MDPSTTPFPRTSSQVLGQLNRNFGSLITTSLGVTAALSFNQAIQSLFDIGGVFHKIGKHGAWYTAFFVTAVAFFATYLFTLKYPDVALNSKSNPIKV